jgi:hypothetical protein
LRSKSPLGIMGWSQCAGKSIGLRGLLPCDAARLKQRPALRAFIVVPA